MKLRNESPAIIRRLHRSILAVLLPAFAWQVANAEIPRPPNVLFIEIEDMNDWVEGFGGHPDTVTPNIRDLASRGVRFDNAHAPSPLCNPSRTAILSGLAPRRTGVLTNQQFPLRNWIPPHAETLFQFFLRKGYYVAGMGKHFHKSEDDQLESWSELQPFKWFRGNPSVVPYHGLPELFDVIRSFDWGPTAGDASEWGDYQIASFGTEFLARAHDSPFFLALGFTLPHLRWQVPQEYWDAIPEAPALPPYLADDRNDAPEPATTRIGSEAHRIITEGGKWQEAIRAYLAAIHFVDDQVGRVLAALDNSAYASNTIVVLWSDHGFHLGEKDAWRKGTLWEESTRVPFTILVPGITTAGGVVDRAVSLLDIYPTLVELAGFEQEQKVDGVSLVDLLSDPVDGERSIDHAVTSYWFGDSIRDSRWRYTVYTEGGEELYDHANDPNEHVNLAALAQYDAVRADLATKLQQATTFGLSLPPRIEILLPLPDQEFSESSVPLAALATDPEDGVLTAGIEWASDIDGPLTLPAQLTPGPHQLTATVVDADGETASAQVAVRVQMSLFVDEDQDGIRDDLDNCLGTANPDQRDTAGDGYGNACDADLDNDGRVSFADLAAFRSHFGTEDPDADLNGDGAVNFGDLASFRSLFGRPPGPSALAP